MKKKILFLIIGLLLISVLMLILILIPPLKNEEYENKLLEDIYKNTNLKDISYINKDNNYYIVKIDNQAVVLDLNFEEIYTKEILIDSILPLVYIRNDLYYEEKIRKNNLKYNYYSTDDESLIFSSSVGGS